MGPDGTITEDQSTALSPDEFSFHAAVLLASGGMILSGDDVTNMQTETKACLRQLVRHTGTAAVFEDETFSCAHTQDRLVFLFNAENSCKTISMQLGKQFHLHDFWTGEALGTGDHVQADLPPHSAKVIALS